MAMGTTPNGFGEAASGWATSILSRFAASCAEGAALPEKGREGEAKAGLLPLGGLKVPRAGVIPAPEGLALTATGIILDPSLHSCNQSGLAGQQ